MKFTPSRPMTDHNAIVFLRGKPKANKASTAHAKRKLAAKVAQ